MKSRRPAPLWWSPVRNPRVEVAIEPSVPRPPRPCPSLLRVSATAASGPPAGFVAAVAADRSRLRAVSAGSRRGDLFGRAADRCWPRRTPVLRWFLSLLCSEPLNRERMRTEFLSLVSHELREPLAAIKGSAVTLLEEAEFEPAEMREFHRIIVEQAGHMRGLIGNLLDTGRIESGTLSVVPEPSEVAALVERARNTFSGRRRPARRPRRPVGRPAPPDDGRPPARRAGAQQWRATACGSRSAGGSSRRKAVASMPSAQAAAATRPSPFMISAARYDADPGCASSGGVPARPRSPRGCSVDRGAGVPVGRLMWHRPPRARLAGYTSRPAAAAAPREVGIGALRVEGVSPAAGRGAATVHRHPTAGGPPGVLPANRRGSRRRGRWGLARGLPPGLPDLQGRTELKTQDLVQRP